MKPESHKESMAFLDGKGFFRPRNTTTARNLARRVNKIRRREEKMTTEDVADISTNEWPEGGAYVPAREHKEDATPSQYALLPFAWPLSPEHNGRPSRPASKRYSITLDFGGAGCGG